MRADYRRYISRFCAPFAYISRISIARVPKLKPRCERIEDIDIDWIFIGGATLSPRLVIAVPVAVAVASPTGNSSYRASTHGRFINDDTRNFAVESIENARRLISKYHRAIALKLLL